jgi:RNA polymerase sigma-70 factor, ECF subfamily
MSEEIDREVEDLRPVLARMLPDDWDRPIRAHDQAAVDDALRRAWLIVYHRARAKASDRRDAEEIAQEVFCRVLARMGSWSSDDAALHHAYLVRAARNLQYDQWRRRDRNRASDAMYASDRSRLSVGPEDEIMGGLEREALRAALRSLTLDQAQVLRLRIFEELSAEETGAVLGKSATAVRQLQHRAVRALRARLTGDDPENGR